MEKIIIILFLLLVSGCGAQDNTTEQQGNGNQRSLNVENSTIKDVDRQTGQEVSEHLVELATRVPNVEGATAVVLGRYAVVGIDVNGQMERSDVDSVKYAVAEGMKDDPHGARATVIADPDVTARLREIGQDIQAGKPVQGIMNELSDIVGRLMPEVPADLVDPVPENAPEEPKSKMDQQDQQKLDNRQQEQSKHHMD
nr:YhcN/YlaJ family sporulation lipoprotein [Mesobacillus harenae]